MALGRFVDSARGDGPGLQAGMKVRSQRWLFGRNIDRIFVPEGDVGTVLSTPDVGGTRVDVDWNIAGDCYVSTEGVEIIG